MNACTVWIAFRVSSASPLVSASRSCDVREYRRTRRPTTINGTTTIGISTTIASVRRALVSASITSAPTKLKVERSTIDRLTPAIDCTSVVSAVRRESTSPVRVVSKNKGSIRTTRS